MSKLKPWYKVISPREDLREGKPLDASEFAVHLDQVRDGRAHSDYQNPQRFFERTYLTKNLRSLASEVLRRLAGEKTETSPVFNMTTQFGGGKTHALTLLYHLAYNGTRSKEFPGVNFILSQAKLKEVPQAAIAVFVGTEFDSIQGRGGDDGTPKRKTPWAEIAYQLSGDAGFRVIEEHENKGIAPSGEVIRKFLPEDKPVLILIDELLNYISRNRKSGLSAQLYNFIQNLSEEARGNDKVVVVASIPASELEMTADDLADYTRFKKLLDRLGKAVIMASESETSEIIRRRLFEWDCRAIGQDGRLLLPDDGLVTCKQYADWVNQHRQQIPSWFPENAMESFQATYPLHPMVLSVFERKWQELPRFQQTRGILRLLALWISHAYQQGYTSTKHDLLINLGSAPLEDSQFRSALFEQLGESRLEGALTTDIAGKADSHAIRLDQEADESIRKSQTHKKVATAVFFESNGGQTKNTATVPEIRLDVAEPDLELGNIETALDSLTNACYYLGVERNQYRFSLKENLNKRFADRRANIKDEDIDKIILDEIQLAFPKTENIERVFFPEKSSQISDRPVIAFIIMSTGHSLQDDPDAAKLIEAMTKEYGTKARTYKSALIWILPENTLTMKNEARKFIAWKDIQSEDLKLDDIQKRQLDENVKRAKRDLYESVWRAYNKLMLLGIDNTLTTIDLGLNTSSAAENMSKLVLNHLRQLDEIVKDISPRALVKNWPPAFTEWSIKAVRDAFYASPQLPRLLNQEAIKESIARGVAEGIIAYAGKAHGGGYAPFYYKKTFDASDVEISEDMLIIKAEEAEKHIQPAQLRKINIVPFQVFIEPQTSQAFTVNGYDQLDRDFPVDFIEWSATGGTINDEGVFTAGDNPGNFYVHAKVGNITAKVAITIGKKEQAITQPETTIKKQKITWSGEITVQKWTHFYTKVLCQFATNCDLKIKVAFEAAPEGGLSQQQIEETKAALGELSLENDVRVE